MIAFIHERIAKDFELLEFSYREFGPKGGRTHAIELPKTKDLTNLSLGDKIDIRIGIAKCHPDDLYNKKIGRELALSKINNLEAIVKTIQKDYVVLLILDEWYVFNIKEDKEFPRVHL